MGTARQFSTCFRCTIPYFRCWTFMWSVCFWCEGVDFYSGIDETMALGQWLLGAFLTPPMVTVSPKSIPFFFFSLSRSQTRFFNEAPRTPEFPGPPRSLVRSPLDAPPLSPQAWASSPRRPSSTPAAGGRCPRRPPPPAQVRPPPNRSKPGSTNVRPRRNVHPDEPGVHDSQIRRAIWGIFCDFCDSTCPQ